MSEYFDLIPDLSLAVIEAGNFAKEQLLNRCSIEIDNKRSSIDLVSYVDKHSQKLIENHIDIINKKFNLDIHIIGEETSTPEEAIQYIKNCDSQQLIVTIDPLDGTNPYLRGIPTYCSGIALMKGSEPFIAISFEPSTSILTIGCSDKELSGAYKIEDGILVDDIYSNKITNIQWIKRKADSISAGLNCFPYEMLLEKDNIFNFGNSLIKRKIVSIEIGSLINAVAKTMLGDLDLYINSHGSLWDNAPAIAFSRAADFDIIPYNFPSVKMYDIANDPLAIIKTVVYTPKHLTNLVVEILEENNCEYVIRN